MKEQKNNQTNKTKRQSIKQTKTSKKNPQTNDPAEFSVLYFICKMFNFHVLC